MSHATEIKETEEPEYQDYDDGYYAARDYEQYEQEGPQYYQNPRGICEDAPCCGCCGRFWQTREPGPPKTGNKGLKPLRPQKLTKKK